METRSSNGVEAQSKLRAKVTQRGLTHQSQFSMATPGRKCTSFVHGVEVLGFIIPLYCDMDGEYLLPVL